MKCIIQLHSRENGEKWLTFADPVACLAATRPEDVLPVLRRVEEAVAAEGLCAAGYVAYEAAAGLDPALPVHHLESGPLLKMGLYRDAVVQDGLPESGEAYSVRGWEPSLALPEYRQQVERIKEWIASGDTYQVNLTMQLQSVFNGSPMSWFQSLLRSQAPRYAAYLEDESQVVCSVSPELFFRMEGDEIVCRPMKGTCSRGRTEQEDVARARALMSSAKDRAENLMIVDMMRNDLGRIATTGTVVADPLFTVERYPTLWQMTSTVRARTPAGFAEVLRALFPCCSITGAPKVRTMALIRDLEPAPRGIYTGTIGCLMPQHPLSGRRERFATFNVAIRTAHVRKADGQTTYGTGGGIVWDSEAETEHQECETKALILSQSVDEFQLFETLRWGPCGGYFLQTLHEERLASSARYFDFPFDPDLWQAALAEAQQNLPRSRHRVRVTLSATGAFQAQAFELPRERVIWRVGLADAPVLSDNVFLFHKTTQRQMYERFQKQHPDWDDVILWNEKGEITESCVANVLVKLAGEWITPPVECGLLDGTLRRALLRRGQIKERAFTGADLLNAEEILLVNSVRGFIRIRLQRPNTPPD